MFLALLPTISVSASSWTSKRWAIIATGYLAFDGYTDYANSVLEKYSFDEISNLGVAYKEEIRNAITSLAEVSDSDDLIFIYIASHGGGWDDEFGLIAPFPTCIDGSRGDLVDEGLEVTETLLQRDIDGDEEIEDDVWAGIDEGIAINPDGGWEADYYWDDEVREDLAQLNGHYRRLFFFFDGCYSGGFIGDLSDPGRIIVSLCNETEGGYDDFGELFFNALDPDNNAFAVADDPPLGNDDNRVSMWEAFQYAWIYDPKRISGDEHPQIDDNADGLSYPETYGTPGALMLARETYLIPQWNANDLINDGVIDIDDVQVPASAFGAVLGDPLYTPLADVTNNGLVDIDDVLIVANDFGEYAVEWPYWEEL